MIASGSELRVDGISIDGDDLYWVASEGGFSDVEPTVYRMPLAGGTPEVVTRLPRSMLLTNIAVADGAVYGSGITEDFDFQIHRAEFGEDHEVVADDAYAFFIADGSAYYGTSDGLTRNSLAFDSPSVVPGTEGRVIRGAALSPTEFWYVYGDYCIGRVPR